MKKEEIKKNHSASIGLQLTLLGIFTILLFGILYKINTTFITKDTIPPLTQITPQQIIQFGAEPSTVHVGIYIYNFPKFDMAENIDFSDIDYDFVLTSPPFWDEKNRLFDVYNNMKEYSNESFINTFTGIFNKLQQKKCWICIHIPICMYEQIRCYIGDANRIITFNCVGNKKHHTKNKNQIYCYKKK